MTLARGMRCFNREFEEWNDKMTDQQITPSPGGMTPDDVTAHASANTTELATSLATMLATGQAAEHAAALAAALAAANRAYHKARRPWFKKKRFSLPLAVMLVFLIIMISTGGNDPGIFDFTTSKLESQVESATNVTPAYATIGQSVRDGKFAFTVTSVQPPNKMVTDRLGVSETAQGEFVMVWVNVTNIGYAPRTLTVTDQFLISDKGQRFATSAATSSLKGSDQIFVEKINPGQTVYDAPLLFDVPAGTTMASIELHDSGSSSGAKVKLT
jgi:hypothetical protein